MTDREINPYTHFYLYAKGWYEKSSSPINDLKVIASNFSGVKFDYITDNDVYSILYELVKFEISLNPHRLSEIMVHIGEHGIWDGSLNFLKTSPAGDLSRDTAIGNPDFNILPLNKES